MKLSKSICTVLSVLASSCVFLSACSDGNVVMTTVTAANAESTESMKDSSIITSTVEVNDTVEFTTTEYCSETTISENETSTETIESTVRPSIEDRPVFDVFETDYYGALDGHILDLRNGESWANTFALYGYNFSEYETSGYEVNACQENNYFITLAVHGYYPDKKYSSVKVSDYGYFGYTIDCSAYQITYKPPMTWNGLSWGASKDSVISIYGEPNEIDERDYWTKLTYISLEDYMSISFWIYNGSGGHKSGLQKVKVYNENSLHIQ